MKTLSSATVLTVVAMLPLLARPQTPSNATLSDTERQHVVRQARSLPYNLRSAGLAELRCEVRPDWESFFRQVRVDNHDRDLLLPLLSQVRFTVDLAANGKVTVSHSSVRSPNAGTAASLRASIPGMENMIAAFFKTWSLYAFASPLPPMKGDYQIDMASGKYQLTYHQGSAEVRTTLRRDFAMEAVTYATPDLWVEIHPEWSDTAEGFLLTSYDEFTQMKPKAPQHLSVKLDYQSVDGFVLPTKVKGLIVGDAGKVEINLSFANYDVKKRQTDRELASPRQEVQLGASLQP